MKVPINLVHLLFYLVLLIDAITTDIDSNETFCGNKLMLTLKELCSVYNSPPVEHYRIRRQVVQECCRSKCSRRHLVRNYCHEAKSSIRNQLHKPVDENIPVTARRAEADTKLRPAHDTTKGSTRSTVVAGVGTIGKQSDNISLNSHSKGVPQSKSSDRRIRGKRNCKCRKRRAKKLQRPAQLLRMEKRVVKSPNIGHVEEAQRPLYVWKFNS